MNTAKTPAETTIDSAILEQAQSVWRRAAVRRTDRRILTRELADELTAAADAGLPPSAVTGDDVGATLRAWAEERGVTGRAGRFGALIPATLAGIVVGMGLLVAVLTLAFANNFTIEPYAVLFGIYLVSGILSYLLALGAAWMTLSVLGDPRRKHTVSSLAALLPFGAVGAIAGGVAIAWCAGFTTSVFTVVAVIGGVCTVLAVTVVLARVRSLRHESATRAGSAVVGY